MHTEHAARRPERFAMLGVGAAVLPFLVVLFFGWLRTGSLVPLHLLLGRGELFPPAAMLAGQALATTYAVPADRRSRRWTMLVGLCWALVSTSCAGYPVPYAGPSGEGTRLVWASTVAFGLGVIVHVGSRRMEATAWSST